MILIFGGAFQGKLEYIMKKHGVEESQVFKCKSDKIEIDYSKKIIDNLEEFVYACTSDGIEAKEILIENMDKLKDKIIICDDISQGVVSLDKTERAWREMVGRTMLMLGKEAEEVIRVFCGLPDKIK